MFETLIWTLIFLLGALTQYLFSLIDKVLFYLFRSRWESREALQDWYNEVAKALNGVQHAWSHQGDTPSQTDQNFAVQNVDRNIERLEEFRNETDIPRELRTKITNLATRWRDHRDKVQNSNNSVSFSLTKELLQHESEAVHQVIEDNRPSSIRVKIKDLIYEYYQINKNRFRKYQSSFFPPELRSRLENHLTEEEIKKLYHGERDLLLKQKSHTEIYKFNRNGNFTKYFFLVELLSRPVLDSVDVSAGVSVDADVVCAAIEDSSKVKAVWNDIIVDGEINKDALLRSSDQANKQNNDIESGSNDNGQTT